MHRALKICEISAATKCMCGMLNATASNRRAHLFVLHALLALVHQVGNHSESRSVSVSAHAILNVQRESRANQAARQTAHSNMQVRQGVTHVTFESRQHLHHPLPGPSTDPGPDLQFSRPHI